MLSSLSYDDETYHVDVDFNGALTVAYVWHNLTGIYAKGNAKHNPADAYDQQFGSDLAVARAKARLYRKIERKLAKGMI